MAAILPASLWPSSERIVITALSSKPLQMVYSGSLIG